jgi:hypothetical protein
MLPKVLSATVSILEPIAPITLVVLGVVAAQTDSIQRMKMR